MALIKCAYCGKERPEEEMKPSKIIFQDRHPGGKAFVNSKTLLYCGDGPCAGNDQMAHEG
jgi:hypothetical protein